MNCNPLREKELTLYSIVLKGNKNLCVLNRLSEKLRYPYYVCGAQPVRDTDKR